MDLDKIAISGINNDSYSPTLGNSTLGVHKNCTTLSLHFAFLEFAICAVRFNSALLVLAPTRGSTIQQMPLLTALLLPFGIYIARFNFSASLLSKRICPRTFIE